MKENFLKQIHMEWLIEGHLTEKEAIDMVIITEKSMPEPEFDKVDLNKI